MKTKIKKMGLTPEQLNHKIKVFKWAIFGVGLAVIAMWLAWYCCDAIFIGKGIWIDTEELIPEWGWNQLWFNITSKEAIVSLALTGGYVAMIAAYLVICGLNLKTNIKQYLYQLLTISAALIATLICIIKSAEMMINEQFILDVSFTTGIDVYHIQFLLWMTIPAGAAIWVTVIIYLSFKPFSVNTLVADTNILIIAYTVAVFAGWFVFNFSVGWNDLDNPDIISALKDPNTWKHVACFCYTSPIGVFAGMQMVLLICRLVCVMFIYNNRWSENKSHIIIWSFLSLLTVAAFIASHVFKLDFGKLLLQYSSIRIGTYIAVTAEMITCLSCGVYCFISHIRHKVQTQR